MDCPEELRYGGCLLVSLPVPLVPHCSECQAVKGLMMLLSFRMLVSLLLVSAVSLTVRAGEPIKERDVELFAAMESGEIEAELIAPSARQVFVRVTNKSKDQLRIQLPKAFAAVPVLAQMQPGIFPGGMPGGQIGMGPGMGQAGMGQLGMGNQGGAGQGLGGGFNGGGVGQGNQFGNQIGNGAGIGNGIGIGRGAFRVPAGKVGKVSAASFCLEHGKPDPNSKIKYRIVPIEQFVGSDERIVTLCHLLADGSISQNTAQAAAWNLANGISFDQLATMNRVQSKYTGNVRMFNDDELKTALSIVEKLNKHAAANKIVSASTSESSR